MLAKVVIVLAAFAVGVGIAELFGAKNLGHLVPYLTVVFFLTFVVALVYVLMRR